MKTALLIAALAAGLIASAPTAAADNFPTPTWPGDGQADQGTHDDVMDIIDEDGAHPGAPDSVAVIHTQDMEGYDACPSTWGTC